MSDIKKLLQKIDTIGSPLMEDSALPKKFPGYLKGMDNAKDVERKMVGMEEDSAATLAGQTLAKKAASKIIPGVGTALSYKDAWDRWQKGDKVGAAMAGAAGTAFLVPGPGTAVGTALDAANIGRDIKAGEYDDLFKEESVLKKKNKKHDAEIDEGLVGKGIKKGLEWFRNLGSKQKSTPPRVEPTGGIPAGTGTAAGDRVPPGLYNVPAVRRTTDVVPPQVPRKPSSDVTIRPNTTVGPTRAVPRKDSNVIDVDAKEVKPGTSTAGKVAATAAAAGVGVGGGYLAGASPDTQSSQTAPNQSAAETDRLNRQAKTATAAGAGVGGGHVGSGASSDTQSSQTAPAASTTVPPREPVVTVDTQAQPERSFVAPLAGSQLRVPAGASIPTRDFNTGGSALGGDFEARTTPSTPQGFQFSREQEEWLARRGGNPNRQDPYILSRMLKKAGGPTPPLSYFTNQEDREIAKRLGFPEVPLEESYSKSVNRLIRKFENYLDNRFDIVENNYVPKKKNLG